MHLNAVIGVAILASFLHLPGRSNGAARLVELDQRIAYSVDSHEDAKLPQPNSPVIFEYFNPKNKMAAVAATGSINKQSAPKTDLSTFPGQEHDQEQSSLKNSIDASSSSAVGQNTAFLQDIVVAYTETLADKPNNCIPEVDGWSADINAGFGGKYVWLVPVWTPNRDAGLTSIQILIQEEEDKRYSNLAEGAGGPYRYLILDRDSEANSTITNIALWRTIDPSSLPSKRGWPNWSEDINAGRGGDFLYLCWESA